MEFEHGRMIIGETCIDAKVEKGFLRCIEKLIFEARTMIETKIDSDPFFGLTYDPYSPSAKDEEVVKWMCESSIKANVGPMAAVAGAIDRYVMEHLISSGCEHAILDNDGDIAMISNDPVVTILYSGEEDLPLLTITLEPCGEMLSICTSSSKVGHSVSLGNCSLASVISYDPALADACATRLGNLCKISPENGVEEVNSIEGIIGCFVINNDQIALCGNFPIDGLIQEK